MKTPREILLERHQAAEEKLDALREEVLRRELQSGARPIREDHSKSGAQPPGNWLAVLWQQLIWPCRRAWLGLAAAWVCILTVNLVSNGQSAPPPLRAEKASPEVMALLHEQWRLRTELLETQPVADKASPFVPRPRSESEPPTGEASACRVAGADSWEQLV